MGASDDGIEGGIPEIGVVKSEGVELVWRFGRVCTCVIVSAKANGYPSMNCRIW